MKTPDKHQSTWQVLQPYLKGAVHQGFVQVDHHAALAAVCDVDLGQQEIGWWLRRAKTPLFNAEVQDVFTKHTPKALVASQLEHREREGETQRYDVLAGNYTTILEKPPIINFHNRG